MSLSTPEPIVQRRLGIIASKNLDDPEYISELLAAKVDNISHIITNGASQFVLDFARDHGIPFTVYPLTGGRNALWSNGEIAANSDVVYVIATPHSKNAGQAMTECGKRGVKVKKFDYDPFTHWQMKVHKIAEILAATTTEDVQANETIKAIWRIV